MQALKSHEKIMGSSSCLLFTASYRRHGLSEQKVREDQVTLDIRHSLEATGKAAISLCTERLGRDVARRCPAPSCLMRLFSLQKRAT